MEFYLRYDGILPPTGKPESKEAIREYLRPQMEALWQHKPLEGREAFLSYPPLEHKVSVVKEFEGIRFAPLVSTNLDMVCELDILMLWKDEAGNIVNRGDIDNRLKTLFDALTCPVNKNQICDRAVYEKHQPYHVLLEDDKLITMVRVETNRLLDPSKASDEVSLVIKVTTKVLTLRFDNIGL